jgi:hypothetical protein
MTTTTNDFEMTTGAVENNTVNDLTLTVGGESETPMYKLRQEDGTEIEVPNEEMAAFLATDFAERVKAKQIKSYFIIAMTADQEANEEEPFKPLMLYSFDPEKALDLYQAFTDAQQAEMFSDEQLNMEEMINSAIAAGELDESQAAQLLKMMQPVSDTDGQTDDEDDDTDGQTDDEDDTDDGDDEDDTEDNIK